ncbi:MAG TPA: pyridoxal-phosphate dependent enzyme, partial [Candidatus Obscuribacterales bacterium]
MVIELNASHSPNREIHSKKAQHRPHKAILEGDVNVVDIVDDLCELNYLIEDLGKLPSLSHESDAKDWFQLSDDWFQANYLHTIETLKSRCQRNLDLVERAARWASKSDLSQLLESVRKEYLSIKEALRKAYRQKGTMLCARDWQSPVYASSIGVYANRLSDGIAEHVWDYKRDGHLDALVYEERFVEEYAAHLGSKSLKGYLTNCGMAGFSTILHFLADEMGMGQQASVALTPMYFENIHLARGFFPNLEQIQPLKEAKLADWLKANRPSVIFLDAVTNCNDVIAHDFETIFNWARSQADKPLAIVLDTTCLPVFLLRSGLLKQLPDNVLVAFVESLAKYHQFGMDAVTGGIVVLHGQDSLNSSFRKTRARLGTNIADSSVGSLPEPSLKRMMRRMQRHSRNTQQLVKLLESSMSPKGAIESISWLSQGPPTAPWYTSSCFTVHLHKAFSSVPHYRQFERRVVELAQKKRFPIALSTSFGFDVSRLYITAPSTRFEDPFLRISVGTETAAQIKVFYELIKSVDLELGKLWDAANVAQHPNARSESGITSSGPPASVLRGACEAKPEQFSERARDRSANLYAGKEALQEYLSPANYQPTPLVELPDDLNPLRKSGVRIFAKMMPLVPLMNIKSLPAFSMLSEAARRGDLEGVNNIIESSSSNTVLSLSVIARLFGIENTGALVDHSIAPSLTRMLRLFGIEVFLHPAAGHPLFGKMEPRSERAAKCGKQPGWLNPGQYTNPDNPQGFEQWLAPDLWAQTDGRLKILSCALGTCGTMVGVSRGLRKFDPSIEIVACCPAPGHAVPGPREKSLLKDVSFDWQNVANARFELAAEESFAASVKLIRRGILGGPSSGL